MSCECTSSFCGMKQHFPSYSTVSYTRTFILKTFCTVCCKESLPKEQQLKCHSHLVVRYKMHKSFIFTSCIFTGWCLDIGELHFHASNSMHSTVLRWYKEDSWIMRMSVLEDSLFSADCCILCHTCQLPQSTRHSNYFEDSMEAGLNMNYLR